MKQRYQHGTTDNLMLISTWKRVISL